MSTELSIIVCVVVGNPVWRVMEFVATLWFPGDGESDRSLCIQPVSDISSAELLLGLAPRPDSQTWASSCEPSVRCVRSQRGGRTLITAALSRHWFPLSFPWSHTCLSATCLPLPLISTQSAFSSCLVLSWRVKSINSSRRTDTHQWGSCVMSCPDAACHWECEKKKVFFRLDNASMFACTKSSHHDVSFCGVTTDGFSAKAPVKESEKPQLLNPCHLTCHYPWLSREFRARSGGFLFSFSSPWLFSSAVQHIRTNISLEAFITYETGGGESWAVSHNCESEWEGMLWPKCHWCQHAVCFSAEL